MYPLASASFLAFCSSGLAASAWAGTNIKKKKKRVNETRIFLGIVILMARLLFAFYRPVISTPLTQASSALYRKGFQISFHLQLPPHPQLFPPPLFVRLRETIGRK